MRRIKRVACRIVTYSVILWFEDGSWMSNVWNCRCRTFLLFIGSWRFLSKLTAEKLGLSLAIWLSDCSWRLQILWERFTAGVLHPAGQLPPELIIVQYYSISRFRLRSGLSSWHETAVRTTDLFRIESEQWTGQTEDYAGVDIGRRSEIIACTGKVERKAAASAITGDEQ